MYVTPYFHSFVSASVGAKKRFTYKGTFAVQKQTKTFELTALLPHFVLTFTVPIFRRICYSDE